MVRSVMARSLTNYTNILKTTFFFLIYVLERVSWGDGAEGEEGRQSQVNLRLEQAPEPALGIRM